MNQLSTNMYIHKHRIKELKVFPKRNSYGKIKKARDKANKRNLNITDNNKKEWKDLKKLLEIY